MMQNRMLWAAGTLALGLLQAWDSGALQAGTFARGLIAAGIVLPPLAIAAPANQAIRIAALVVAAAFLTWARMISPVPMNALHIGLFPAALYILFVTRWIDMQTTRSDHHQRA